MFLIMNGANIGGFLYKKENLLKMKTIYIDIRKKKQVS